MDTSYFKPLLLELKVGVAVSDLQGALVFRNEPWHAMPESIKQLAEKKLAIQNPGQFLCSQSSVSVSVVRLEEHFVAIVHRDEELLVVKDSILSQITASVADHQNVFKAAANAMGKLLGWRWVAVTRFLNNDKVETLAFWHTDKLVENFEYDIFNTPCDVVKKKKSFLRYDNVAEQFPKDDDLTELGAKVYAGFVYRNRSNEILGHIFLMNDHSNVDWILAEETLHMVSTIIGTTMSLSHSEKQVQIQRGLAHTDKLTQLCNRLAFDSDLDRYVSSVLESDKEHFVLAVIDLDGMKQVNDSLGHNEGDRLLQTFAEQLKHIGREKDHAYRFGGDEFAVIFLYTDCEQVSKLRMRFDKAIEQVRMQGFPQVGASIGFVSSQEYSGDSKLLMQHADQRMYQDKAKKQN